MSKLKLTRLVAVLAIVLSSASWVSAEPRTFSSGDRHVTLIELYTSEGCSSCPPADRWLSDLTSSSSLWRDIVPVAFHVDYWDYLGWRDRFAHPAYAARQRRYTAEGVADAVYTPGVFAAGREWLGWRRGHLPTTSGRRAHRLVATIDDGRIDVHFAAGEFASKNLVAHAAVLGMGRQTAVPAGENRGALLRHDFVVLGHYTETMQVGDNGFVVRLDADIPREGPLALAVWVEDRAVPGPLQATGGWLEPRSAG